jgi:outer membrane protein insertion porin family
MFFLPGLRLAGWITFLIVAATASAAQPSVQNSGYEISSIRFAGNETLSRNELIAQMTTRETPGFFSKFLHYSISEKVGRAREYFNGAIFAGDLKRLRRYYQSRGFDEAVIDSALEIDTTGMTVDLIVRIREGRQAIIDSLAYLGVIPFPPYVWDEINSSPRISAGRPYNAQLLEEEVNRVLRLLRNYGFPNVSFVRDSSYAARYASTGNYRVRLMFDLGRFCVFGPIKVRQDIDTAHGQVYREDITDDILLQQLTYEPGKYFNTTDSVESLNNLLRLGVFNVQQMSMRVPSRTDSSNVIPTMIVIRPKDRHEMGPEVLVSDENGSLNLGAGLGYTHRNFFGGARTFSAHLRFRTQTLNAFPNYFARNTDAVSNLDLTFEIVQPYVFSNRVKGSWSFSYIVDKQRPYLQEIVRNKFGFTNKFAPFTNGFYDWTLEAIGSVDTAKIAVNTSDPEILRQRRLMQVPQFTSVLSFTIQRDKTDDLFSPSSGFVHSLTLDDAGLTGALLTRVFPKHPFTQFYRISATGRWYSEVVPHRFSILGFKLKGGIEDLYGSSKSDPSRIIPQTHRFYAGGGSSVRGWNSRELIAGDPALAQYGGNVSLEGSMELRTAILQNLKDDLFDKIWIVQFLDAGNVWPRMGDFRLSEVAIAAGLGIRYDTFFGPFRMDWGFRVFNPSEPVGQQWITQRKLFGQTFKEGVFHFGIGHAF